MREVYILVLVLAKMCPLRTTLVLQTLTRPLSLTRYNSFNRTLMVVHLSKGFYFVKSRQPLDSSFFLEKRKWERVGPTTQKTQSLLGMPCTGIQESRVKLFCSLQLPVTNVKCPSPQACVGKARGRRGWSEGRPCFFGWPKGFFFFFKQGIELSYFSVFQFSDV